MRRVATIVVGALAGTVGAALLGPGVVAADPAGPTDYESEITGVDPIVDTVTLSIAGGDSFVVIDVEAGTDVVVLGYQAEPYLWIAADGVVAENRRSPATYENTERYGTGALPAQADATAPPEWVRVGDGGSWAWHDHRAHRMDPFPPANAERGDQVLDAVVPLLVDDVEVGVRVASTWMPAPSRWPIVAGVLVGLGIVVAGRRLPACPLALVSLAAVVVGAVQFRSLPAATDPRHLWWIAPAVALVSVVAALVVHRLRPREATIVLGATAIACVQLIVWGWERRAGLSRAVLPTDAPFWLDRLVSAAALAAGVAGVVAMSVTLVMSLRGRSGATGTTITNRPAPARSPG